MAVEVGQEAPDFELKDQHGQPVRLSGFRGEKNVVLVFYPLAFSGVCSGELCAMRDDFPEAGRDDVELLTVSVDSTWVHRVWAEQQGFEFGLLSDFWPHGGVAQAYGMLAGGIARRALVIGGDVLSKIVDWSDRTTCIVFGDGAGAVVMERVDHGGFLGFELGSDGSGGMQLYLPAGGSRTPTTAETVAEHGHFVHMNGREVFKFATRVLVTSAQKLLDQLGLTVDDIDLYVPHQANVRIIKHAVERLGIPEEKVVVNVDRYGNTSSGSIPLALADAVRDRRVEKGDIVLMTGMGAGLTWGSGVIEWTEEIAA